MPWPRAARLAAARGQLLLLRHLEPVAGPARRRDGDPRLPPRPRDRAPRPTGTCARPACWPAAWSTTSALLVLLQVRQLLPRLPVRRAPRPGRRLRCRYLLDVILPVRHLVLHVRGDQLHGGRLPRRIPAERNLPTSCCSSCSSRTWSPGRSSAAGTSCRRSAGRSAGTGCACSSACSSSCWGCSRSWPSPTAWPCSSIRCSPIPDQYIAPGRVLAGRRSPTPCRSTATSPATPTWPSAAATCSATS